LTFNDDELLRRIRPDPADSWDEEFKLEQEDRNPDELFSRLIEISSVQHKESHRPHFRELFRVGRTRQTAALDGHFV
jgi:hypothetical protein